LATSDAGGVVLDQLRGPAEHHCRCHHRPDEDCDCPRCHRALVAAAEDGRLPPCHRAAAKARLARAAKPPVQACIKGSCGSEDQDTPRAPHQEPLVLSRVPQLCRVSTSAPAAMPTVADGRDAEGPAAPPPRAS